MDPKLPKVFISYSHDSGQHMNRVLSLSNRLREDGVDCHIDQYEESPSAGWPRWMMKQIKEADFVLVVCTKQYNLRFSGEEKQGTGLGVKWEGAILSQELYEADSNNSKFIPLLFLSEDGAEIPAPLRAVTYYELNHQTGYERLYRRLTGQPSIIKPALGKLKRLFLTSSSDHQATEDTNSGVTQLPLASSDIPKKSAPMRPLVDIVKASLNLIEESTGRSAGITGISTGFNKLDKLTLGFHPSELIIVGARPSVGKTAFATSIALHAATVAQKTVAIFSLEMSSEQLFERMMCSQARISSHKLRAGYLNRDEWSRLSPAIGALIQSKLYIDDPPEINLSGIRSKLQQIKDAHGLDLLVIDYLELMSDNGQPYENRGQGIASIGRGLKLLGRELSIPIIALSQLSKTFAPRGDPRPQLTDLNGSLEQHADLVIFLYRKEIYVATDENRDIAEIIVAKQRNGPVSSFDLAFLKEFGCFENLEGPG